MAAVDGDMRETNKLVKDKNLLKGINTLKDRVFALKQTKNAILEAIAELKNPTESP